MRPLHDLDCPVAIAGSKSAPAPADEQAAATPTDIEARFIAEHGHRLAQMLRIDAFDIADRDAQIMAALKNENAPAPADEQPASAPIDTPTDREFALSAAICVHPKGVYGDEGGSMCCPITHTRDASFAPSPADEREAFEKVFPMPAHCQRIGHGRTAGYAPTEYGAWEASDFIRRWEGWQAARAASANETGAEGVEPMAVPAGWKLVRVNEHFDALIAALERAESKGYLPETMREEWENFAYDENVTASPPPAQAAEPVAQWQSRLKDRSSPVVDHWVNISPDGAKTLMEKYANVYEVRALYAAPQPPEPADAREGLAAIQAALREIDPKWTERGEFGVKPHEQIIAAIRDLAAPQPPAQADAREGLTDEQRTMVRTALAAAKQFIANGVELGFIRMPDTDCPDPAHSTPKLIDGALALLDAHPGRPEPRAEVTDSARLDWIAHHGISLRQDPDTKRWFLVAPYHTKIECVDDHTRFESARAAIDAARAGEAS